MTEDEIRGVWATIAVEPQPDFVLVSSWALGALWTALGYKAWIESKGRRGSKPPSSWIGSV